jgi:hypothetical protein
VDSGRIFYLVTHKGLYGVPAANRLRIRDPKMQYYGRQQVSALGIHVRRFTRRNDWMTGNSAPVQLSAIDLDSTNSSGVSWAAVFGGAFVAAAFYLMLLALGAGMELSSISPWSGGYASPSSLTNVALGWLVFSEIVASALGGYLAGRLRIKWAAIHTDEVFFRDTANGFLAWAVALVISVIFLASAATSMVGRVAQAHKDVQAAGVTENIAGPEAYFVDSLFRSEEAVTAENDATRTVTVNKAVASAEAARIVANALRQNQMPAADQNYLTHLIAGTTGISQSDTGKRISDVLSDARQKEDTARKSGARLLIWLFFALIMGAFSASCAAMIGGKQRDHVRAA